MQLCKLMSISANANSNRYPRNNDSVPLHPGYRMVYRRLPFAYHGFTTIFWQDLHVLLNQICLTLRSTSFRNWLSNFCSLAKFSRLHSWKSSEWHWRCGYFWRRKYVNVFFLTLKIWTSSISLIFCSDLNSACRPTSPRCTLHEHHVKHVWCRRSDWAPCRRCLHQQCTIDLAVLLLYKSTYDLTM